jgi:hypothetical protein
MPVAEMTVVKSVIRPDLKSRLQREVIGIREARHTGEHLLARRRFGGEDRLFLDLHPHR